VRLARVRLACAWLACAWLAAGTCDNRGMPIRAVAFDIGGVLERVQPYDVFTDRWRRRLGLTEADFAAALAPVNRTDVIGTGVLSEPEIRQAYAAAFGLTDARAEEFMADLWDWYCGELDHEMTSYARSLRPRYRTGILSNSMHGARRVEEERFGFSEMFDVIVYSHEIGLVKPDPRAYQVLLDQLGAPPDQVIFIDDRQDNVDAAARLGMHGVLNADDTAATISAVEALLTS
jgi:epoxide hydrolase-like predicted phosphatase